MCVHFADPSGDIESRENSRIALAITESIRCSIFSGFDETLKSLSGGKLNYETKLSSAGLIFWFYGQQVIAKILQLDSNKVKS